MAKRKAPLKKSKVSFQDIKKKFSTRVKYKEDSYLDLGEAFQKACGIPGPAEGHVNMLLGHSDTGKTTALVQAGAIAQKKGKLPVFIITEQKWSFEHAKLLGLECEKIVDEESGEVYWDGLFIDKLGFEYVEQVFDYMNSMLDEQAAGNLPYDLVFCVDSIGSIPCEMSFNGKGGNQHTARVISEKWGMGLAQRITSSRKETSPYTNTAIFVNQPWVEIPIGYGAVPRIKPKGGNSIFLSSSLVFLFGNEASAGVSRIPATKNGRKVNFAMRTKVGIYKNHMNGLGFSDGRIIATPHGFLEASDGEIKKYKAEHADYWFKVFESFGDQDNGDIILGDDEAVGSIVETSDDF